MQAHRARDFIRQGFAGARPEQCFVLGDFDGFFAIGVRGEFLAAGALGSASFRGPTFVEGRLGSWVAESQGVAENGREEEGEEDCEQISAGGRGRNVEAHDGRVGDEMANEQRELLYACGAEIGIYGQLREGKGAIYCVLYGDEKKRLRTLNASLSDAFLWVNSSIFIH